MRRAATSNPARDLALAVSMLTVVPVRTAWPEGERPDVAGYFPVAGLVVGAAGAAIIGVTSLFDAADASASMFRSFLIAASILAVWALLTRMLHWDALADVADAYWGASDAPGRLAIMSDPHVGAFGATAVTLVALVQVAALGMLVAESGWLAVAGAASLGRFAAVFGCWFGRPARPTGLGASVAGPPRPASAIAAGLVLALVGTGSYAAGVTGLLTAGVCVLIAMVVPHVLSKRFAGVTGDVLGASVMLTEACALVLFALVW